MSVLLLVAGCQRDDSESSGGTIPEVTFDREESEIRIDVGEIFEISAVTVVPETSKSKWYVNGVVESTTPSLLYKFNEAGNYTVRSVATNAGVEFSKEFSVRVLDVLSIRLSIADSTLVSRPVNSNLVVTAIIEAGDNVHHEWSIDDVVVGNTAQLNYRLDEVKRYEVYYRAYNDDDEYTQAFAVQTTDGPLQVTFSETDETLQRRVGDNLSISVNVLSGGTGLTHQWTLDDVPCSSTDTFTYPCAAEGTFSIGYSGVNALGEQVDKTWTLTVVPASTKNYWLISDFEGNATLGARFTLTNTYSPNWKLEIVDNPKVSAANSSARCLKVDFSSSVGTTSGIVDVNFVRTHTGNNAALGSVNDVVDGKYTKLRVKVYRGNNPYFPYPEKNSNGAKLTILTDVADVCPGDWEIMEVQLPAQINFFTFRVLKDKNGQNVGAGVGDGIIYFDDFELIEE